jgi:NAD(P)-dependent dehydrogenase (short-subunit alcohol dehydrogenase family)
MAEMIALVTGANKGIGREISRQLAAKGVFVLMGARDRERGERAVAEFRSQGLPVEMIQIDVTSDASVAEAAKEIERRHGWLDILVNNAGIAPRLDSGFRAHRAGVSEYIRDQRVWRVSGDESDAGAA